MNVYEELKARGIIAQVTDEEAVEKKLTQEKIRFYIGRFFDKTGKFNSNLPIRIAIFHFQ